MNAILPLADPAAPPAAATIAWTDGIVDPHDHAVREIAAPCSLAEALSLTTLDTTRPVLVRMMQPGGPALFYARAEWEETIVLPGARIAAMDLPQGKGGSRIFAILAVIVAAALLGPEVAVLLGYSEAGTAAAIATSVIGMAGTALVNALLPPPAPAALKQEQASPTYSLNAQGNYARLGQAVEEQFGRHIHYPSLLTAYKEFPGDDEYLYLALGLGEGEFEILEWGWAGTPAWRAEPYNLLGRADWTASAGVTIADASQPHGLSDWEIRLAGDGARIAASISRAWPSGQTITLSFIAWTLGTAAAQTLTASLYNVPGVSHNFAVDDEPQVFAWTFSSADSAMAAAVARFAATLAAGVEIRIKDVLWHRADYVAPFVERPPNQTYGYTGAFPGVAHEIVPPGGAPSLIVDAVHNVQAVGGQVLLGTNESGAGWLGPFVANPPNTEALSLAFDIMFTRGLYHQNDDGSFATASVSVEAQIRPIDEAGVPTGAGTWTSLFTQTFTLKSGPKLIRRTVKAAVAFGRYEARLKRTNAKSADAQTFDECIWGGLKAYFAPTESTGTESWMMVSAKAGDQLQGSAAAKLYVVKMRKLPVWTGAAWSAPRLTRSPAWALAHVFRSVWPAGEIDTAQLASLAGTWHLRGDCFDGIFDNAQPSWDVLKAIARAGRARPILPGGALSLVRDEPHDILSATLGPGNTLPGSTSLDYIVASSDLADRLIVEYLDERTWRMATVTCVLPGVTPLTTKRVKFPYIVRGAQAWREGMFALAENAWRRVFAATETEAEGLMLWPGHRVLFGHDAVNWGEGAIVAAFDGNRVVMDRDLGWEDGETHMLALTERSGRTWGPVAVTRESAHVALLPDPLPGGLVAPATVCVSRAAANGRIEACRALFGWGVTIPKKMLVRGAVPRAGGRARLALVIDDARVHTADAGMPPPPAPPPDPPAPEDLDISYIVEVSGGGSHWVTSYTVTSLGAGVRHIEWVHNGVDMGRAPNLTGWTKATTTAPIHGGEARGVGRYGAGDWVDWLYLPEGGGEL